MMNLWELLKVSKGLPPPDLETLLFARKLSGQPVGGGRLETITASGYPCVLENSAGLPAAGYKIYGNTVQNGTPSPGNPVEIKSVGEPVFAKLYDSDGFRLTDSDGYKLCSQDVVGYCIPVVTSGANHESLITNIYLDEPLRKIGDYADVLDFKKQQIVRNLSEIISNEMSVWFLSGSNRDTWKRYPIGYVISDLSSAGASTAIKNSRIPVENSSESTANSTGMTCRKGSNRRLWVFVPFEVLGNIPVDNTDEILAAWSNWVSENPFTVEYIAEPTTETLALPKIPTFSGTTIISTDTEVEPSDIEITYKSRR